MRSVLPPRYITHPLPTSFPPSSLDLFLLHPLTSHLPSTLVLPFIHEPNRSPASPRRQPPPS
jgi:hypothetical protein